MKRLTAALFILLAASQALAQGLPQDWQVRGICDLRKPGSGNREAECALVASEVLMLLPEKAGPGNVAVLAEFSANLEKAGTSWEAPCRDQAHCPDAAYTIRYAFVSRKVLSIPREKVFTALVCREGFSDTAPDDAACRAKLMRVLREMTVRARKEGALLAVLKCGGAEPEAIRPGGQGVAGYELVYAFVQLPDMLPMAGADPKAAAQSAVNQIAGPPEAAGSGSAGAKTPGAQAARPAPGVPIPYAPASAAQAQGASPVSAQSPTAPPAPAQPQAGLAAQSPSAPRTAITPEPQPFAQAGRVQQAQPGQPGQQTQPVSGQQASVQANQRQASVPEQGARQPQAAAQSGQPAASQSAPQSKPQAATQAQASAQSPAQASAQSPTQASAQSPAHAADPAPAIDPPLAAGEVLMQVAALPSLVQAEAVADKLSAKGIEATFERAEVGGREVYRVLARGKGTPEGMRQKLAEMGYPGAVRRQ